jgi:predicted amidohydrolase
MSAVQPYTALALQTTCHAINRAADVGQARQMMLANIERVGQQVRSSKQFIGPEVKLGVLPEYFASSYPLGDPLPVWAARAAWAPDGPEYTAVAALARASAVYLSGNVYETDALFPGLYFQTSFIVNDSGTLVLRYRRLVSMFAPTPHDVWDRYLEHYGLDAVFPVADTPLGRLACIASEEILYPEIARALALRGAEVFLHSTSEVGSP